jgi:drug/metabolite transporter (DMT)-like permease
MTSARAEYRLGLLLVMAAAVAWSTSGLFTRALTLDTPTILFWRGLFGAIGTAMVMAVIPGAGGLRAFGRLGRPGVAYAAVTAASMLFFISALQNTSVAHVAIITAIVPFVAAYLGWVIQRERPMRGAIVASGVALAGVAIMAGISRDGQPSGDVLAVLMAICMAGMILISRRYGSIPALAATCLASALSAAAMLPFANVGAVSTHDLGIRALFGLVNQVLGFGLFALGARLLPPMETALITALDAPLAPLWVWLVFTETPGQATIVGGCVVFAAVVGHILWGDRRPEHRGIPGDKTP